jgi:hypothetical protein
MTPRPTLLPSGVERAALLQRLARRASGARGARQQRGMATILMALLVGAMVMAGTVSVVQYVRSSQEEAVTVHAQTQAQMNAWAGAEMVRQYLERLSAADRSRLVAAVNNAGGIELGFSNLGTLQGLVSARLLSGSTSTELLAQIRGTTSAANLKAKATSTLYANFGVATGASVLNKAYTSGGAANQSLTLTGSITVLADNAAQAAIAVTGDVVLSAYSVSGLSTIDSTGSIYLDSGGTFATLNANCDVTLKGSANASAVNALRNVCTSGGAAVTGTATANGNIILGSQGNGTVQARSDPVGGLSCSATGTANNCPTPTVAGVDMYSAGYSGAGTVNAAYDVYINGAANTINAGRNIGINSYAAVSNAANYVESIIANGYLSGTARKVAANAIPAISPAAAVVVPTDTPFNAWAFSGIANYLFFESAGTTKVKVANVSGIPAGVYFLVNSRICSVADCSSGTNVRFCTTHDCLSYSNATWTFNSWVSPILRGVVWFKGNLALQGGTYYNTFIATGNISTTNGSNLIYAPNNVSSDAASSNPVCAGTYYPTHFCPNGSAGNFDATAASGVGPYAFMAGSYAGGAVAADGTVSLGTYSMASYTGGLLNFAANTDIYGYVLAGAAFLSNNGNVNVYGYINSQGSSSTYRTSGIGSATTMDLRNLPSKLGGVGLGDGSAGSKGGANAGADKVDLKYVRYL